MSTGDDDAKTRETPDEPAPVAAPAAGEAAAATDTAAAAAEVSEEEDPWPFDEEGVFRIRRKEEVDLSPFTFDDPHGDDSRGLRFSSHDELTLDAFEKAVSRKIHEQLGAASPEEAPVAGAPRGADELVASMLGALTGKDARTALTEVRQKLAAGPAGRDDEPRGADIIDLQAAREARKRPAQSEAASRIGDVIKDTVNTFMQDYACETGCDTVSIDGEFLKAHGNALLGSLFQGLAQALLPQVAQLTGAPPTTTTKPGQGPVDVDELARWEEEAAAAPPADDAGAASEGPAAAEAPTTGADAALQPTKPADTKTESTPAAASAKTPEGAAPRGPTAVSVKVDVGSILANLFSRRPKS